MPPEQGTARRKKFPHGFDLGRGASHGCHITTSRLQWGRRLTSSKRQTRHGRGRKAMGPPNRGGCTDGSPGYRKGKSMQKFAQRVGEFGRREDGPTAGEYAVMLALIVVVCITAITTLGKNANNTFITIGKASWYTGSTSS